MSAAQPLLLLPASLTSQRYFRFWSQNHCLFFSILFSKESKFYCISESLRKGRNSAKNDCLSTKNVTRFRNFELLSKVPRDSTKQRLDLGSACLKTFITTLILTKLLRYVRLALTWRCLPLFIVAYQKWIHSRCPEIKPRTFRIASNKSYTEPCSPLTVKGIVMNSRWLVAKKSLNMMENMMDPNIIDYTVLCNTIYNHNRKSLPNRFLQACLQYHYMETKISKTCGVNLYVTELGSPVCLFQYVSNCFR